MAAKWKKKNLVQLGQDSDLLWTRCWDVYEHYFFYSSRVLLTADGVQRAPELVMWIEVVTWSFLYSELSH
jgi:hypothetical protein